MQETAKIYYFSRFMKKEPTVNTDPQILSMCIPLNNWREIYYNHVVWDYELDTFPLRVSNALERGNKEDIESLFNYATILIADNIMEKIGDVKRLFNEILIITDNWEKRSFVLKN